MMQSQENDFLKISFVTFKTQQVSWMPETVLPTLVPENKSPFKGPKRDHVFVKKGTKRDQIFRQILKKGTLSKKSASNGTDRTKIQY